MSIFFLSYIFLLLISFLFIFVEIFTFPGFIKTHLYFDMRILVLFTTLVSIINLFRKNPDKFPTIFQNTNNFILLPLTFGLTLAFTIIEMTTYPNFVFSKFHINYDCLLYLFILSSSIFIFSFDKKEIISTKETIIFGFSVLLIFCLLMIRAWPGATFHTLIREDSIFEYLQFMFYLIAAISSFLIALRSFKYNLKFSFIYFFLFSLFLFFIAGEEISWGQRIIGLSSPDIAVKYNTQQETTLHNIKGLNDIQPILYITFSLFLYSSWAFIKILPSKIEKKLSYFVPGWYLSLYFLPIFIFYFHINIASGSHWEWQEACELLLALGLFIFIIEKLISNKITFKN